MKYHLFLRIFMLITIFCSPYKASSNTRNIFNTGNMSGKVDLTNIQNGSNIEEWYNEKLNNIDNLSDIGNVSGKGNLTNIENFFPEELAKPVPTSHLPRFLSPDYFGDLLTKLFNLGTRNGKRPLSFEIRKTNFGQIRGIVEEALPGRFSEYYLGVPYAAPPVQDLRFEKPTDPPMWNDIKDVNSHPPACLQPSLDYVRQYYSNFDKVSEDCLYLNIYVPKNKKPELFPVLIYIHGGRNMVGTASMFDGDVFAIHNDVIVVTINYRLGMMGFFTMKSPDFAGNYGLWDQLLAIKWVHENIQYFWGDKERITLAGHNAGGADASIHFLSQHAKGLFRYAICLSGVSLSPYVFIPKSHDSANEARRVANVWGCNQQKIADLKKCLKLLPSSNFNSAKPYGYRFGVSFSNNSYEYIRSSPEDLLQEIRPNVEAVLTGVTHDEGMEIFFQEKILTISQLRFLIIQLNKDIEDYPNLADLIIHEYLPWNGKTNPYESQEAMTIAASKYWGDYMTVFPTVNMAEILSQKSSRVYFYSFNHYSASYHLKMVPHGEDLYYLFGAPMTGHPLRSFTKLDEEVSKKYMSLFGSFIKTGEVEVDSYTFEPYNTKDKSYIKISSENNTALLQQDRNLFLKRMDFWTQIRPVAKDNVRILNTGEAPVNESSPILRILTGILAIFCFVELCIVIYLGIRFKRMTSVSTSV
ncbi:acetylcholinesterase-like, partial [Argonauta hians]